MPPTRTNRASYGSFPDAHTMPDSSGPTSAVSATPEAPFGRMGPRSSEDHHHQPVPSGSEAGAASAAAPKRGLPAAPASGGGGAAAGAGGGLPDATPAAAAGGTKRPRKSSSKKTPHFAQPSPNASPALAQDDRVSDERPAVCVLPTPTRSPGPSSAPAPLSRRVGVCACVRAAGRDTAARRSLPVNLRCRC